MPSHHTAAVVVFSRAWRFAQVRSASIGFDARQSPKLDSSILRLVYGACRLHRHDVGRRTRFGREKRDGGSLMTLTTSDRDSVLVRARPAQPHSPTALQSRMQGPTRPSSPGYFWQFLEAFGIPGQRGPRTRQGQAPSVATETPMTSLPHLNLHRPTADLGKPIRRFWALSPIFKVQFSSSHSYPLIAFITQRFLFFCSLSSEPCSSWASRLVRPR